MPHIIYTHKKDKPIGEATLFSYRLSV